MVVIFLLLVFLLGNLYFLNIKKQKEENIVTIKNTLYDNVDWNRNFYKEYYADRPDFFEVKKFISETIELVCPYYYPNGIQYKQCLSNYLDSLQANNGIQEDSEKFSGYKKYCDEYALSEGEEGFGGSTVAYTGCLIYKINN